MKSLISIIIPIYNVEKYLPKCIDSILEQTYTNLEIILVNDGSPDDCKEICDRYSERDKRIKVIHKKNGGLSDARNSGLEIASGEYVLFLDSDDFLTSPNCIEHLYTPIKNYPYEISYGRWDILYPNGKINIGFPESKHQVIDYKKSNEDIFSMFLQQKEVGSGACGTLYNRNFLITNDIKFKKGLLHEDYWWCFLVFSSCNSFYKDATKPIFYYCQYNEKSITSSLSKKNAEDIQWTCLSIIDYSNHTSIPINIGKDIITYLEKLHRFIFRIAYNNGTRKEWIEIYKTQQNKYKSSKLFKIKKMYTKPAWLAFFLFKLMKNPSMNIFFRIYRRILREIFGDPIY